MKATLPRLVPYACGCHTFAAQVDQQGIHDHCPFFATAFRCRPPTAASRFGDVLLLVLRAVGRHVHGGEHGVLYRHVPLEFLRR